MTDTTHTITLRRAEDRGHTRLSWLDSRHTFSFGQYHDPAHMGHGPLRVINDDRVAPGTGFGEHGHRDMEILSWVLEGRLEHRDSLGDRSVLGPGDLQFMTAGTGIRHSERNPSAEEPVHFLQIWIEPDRPGHEPRYGERHFPEDKRRNRWALLASPDGREGSAPIHQNADVLAALLDSGATITHRLDVHRMAWVHVARGQAVMNDQALGEGDGAAIPPAASITLTGSTEAEILLFDLPAE